MAEKKGFDLGAMLASVSNPDTSREQIEYIDLDKIDADAKNFYSMPDLEELAAGIAMIGLQQPLRIRPNPDAPGRYRVVSGHRRRAALGLLAQEDPARWKQVACIVEASEQSEALQQLKLIFGNAHTRKLSSADQMEQAEQVEKLLYQLKEEGYEFPGRMRDHVAAAVNASTTKLARLKVIREKLAFCWKPAFQDSSLGESVAYALAQMPAPWQELIYGSWGTKPKSLYEDSVREYKKRFENIANIRCGPKKDITCVHQTKMMERSCKDRWSDPCWNTYCCMECRSLQTCGTACKEAASKKKELKAAAEEAKIRQKEDTIRREKPIIDFIREVYKRVGIAREIGCVSVEKLYSAERMMYSAITDDPKQKSLEDGTAKININTNLPFGYSSYASSFMIACAVADALNCSIDYLLGRSEDLRPAGGWQTGDPWNIGHYVVLVRWPTARKVSVMKMGWDGEHWYLRGSMVDGEDVEILNWIELPEEVQENG